MSDKKTYTASEVARMILEKTHQTLRKHEELLKSKNSAHEIDLGEEPNNDEAECPESLKASGSASSGEKSEKKPKAESSESSEDPAMEDEPLSDFENEVENEAEEEIEEAEEESEEEQEPKKIFKKSESGMFTVQYTRLAKARVDEGKPDDEKREAREKRNNRDEKEDKRKGRDGKHWSNSRETIGVHIPVNKDSGKNANYNWHGSKKAVDRIKNRSSTNTRYRDLPPNLPKSEEIMKEEENQYEFKKSESGMFTVQYTRLAKYDENIKGVHQNALSTDGSSNHGESDAGRNAKAASSSKKKGFYNHEREQKQTAKRFHQGVIDEQKAMKKPNLPKSEKMMKDDTEGGEETVDFGDMDKQEKPKESQRISFKRFERGDKKMTRGQHAESMRTAQHPENTRKEFQDPRKKMGQWRQRKHKETGNLDYLKGKKDSEYKEE
jgi:hypothetical protein